jgi:hypothetical protein
MAQGFDITSTQIVFYEAPANLAAVVVKEYAVPATGGNTDVWALSAWSDEDGYPSRVEFYKDRLVFASSTSSPQTVWMSKAANYTDFGRSTPLQDDDAITAVLNARQVNAIQDLVALQKLLILTTGGEWLTTENQDGVLAPSTIGFDFQSYIGSSSIPAILIGKSAIFVQNRGYIVRDIGYRFEDDGYVGDNLTTFSSHLTEGKAIVSAAYQQIPYSIVWFVREDGVLLAMTYVKEQNVVGWTQMEIDGLVESIAVIPEGGEDSLYLSINRNGTRFIERLNTRLIDDVREGIFLDAALTYDGRNTTAKTLTVTGSTWAVGDSVTVTASASTFVVGDVGDVVVMGYTDGFNARLLITAYTSATVVTATIETPIDTTLRATATTDWGIARDVMSGLDHLEDETVGILSDGFVQEQQVVASGSITLGSHGVLVHVGLPYLSDFETLTVNVPGNETTRMRNKAIKRVGVILQDSRSIFAGSDADHLTEYEPRNDESMVSPPALVNGVAQIWISSDFEENGRVFIRQSDPLPMAILGVIPEVEFGSK